ncbi:MAG: hypothetical protein MPJ50_13700, partial [Pirellulales bacterium]|nr:hypothetical protein [Pirellulales bacterium]
MSSATAAGPLVSFAFDANLRNSGSSVVDVEERSDLEFVKGLTGKALSVTRLAEQAVHIPAETLDIEKAQGFSVQFWVRTDSSDRERFVLVSQKDFLDNSLASQKHAGWVFCYYNCTWACIMGSGDRRIAYERDNGVHMPLNDGRWHQLTMTYSHEESTVRLYYDGKNQVLYNVDDSNGFDFSNMEPVVVGWKESASGTVPNILPLIAQGAEQLQKLVSAFNALGLKAPVNNDDFMRLATDPERLFRQKVRELQELNDPGNAGLIQALNAANLETCETLSRQLQRNPFTIHQSADFMQVAPLLKLYSVVDGSVHINRDVASAFAKRARLHRPNFDIDNLAIWARALSSQEVLDSYSAYFQPTPVGLPENRSSLTVASWNIHHGGKHETIEEDGWDSRRAIVEMIKRENIDIVMMQETYSSGDFIAAELGYY